MNAIYVNQEWRGVFNIWYVNTVVNARFTIDGIYEKSQLEQLISDVLAIDTIMTNVNGIFSVQIFQVCLDFWMRNIQAI